MVGQVFVLYSPRLPAAYDSGDMERGTDLRGGRCRRNIILRDDPSASRCLPEVLSMSSPLIRARPARPLPLRAWAAPLWFEAESRAEQGESECSQRTHEQTNVDRPPPPVCRFKATEPCLSPVYRHPPSAISTH
jgi:hypothetical protein